jgi:hypothetical protein
VLGHDKPHISRCGRHSKHVLHAYHKHNIGPPHRILLSAGYGGCIDGMLRAGKLREWKQIFIMASACCR